MKTKLEKLAYAHATAQYLSEKGEIENWYKAYAHLIKCVEKDEVPENLIAWQPFETWEWKDIASQIDCEAESLLSSYKQVLELAKQGIVKSAIEATLDSDMNLLHMESMIELGAYQGAATLPVKMSE